SISAIDLSDEEMEGGKLEQTEEGEVDDPMLEDVALPVYNDERLQEVRRLQNDDELKRVKEMIKGEEIIPSKTEALSLPQPIQKFLRHRSLFRISAQNVLHRLWLNSKGEVCPLIAVGAEQFDELINDVHSFKAEGENTITHCGTKKTQKALEKHYYCFNMREKIHNFISKCGVCRLNNHPSTHPESSGAVIRTEPMTAWTIDYCGPLSGFCSSATGRPRYIFLAVDQFSRFCVTFVTNSVDDTETMKALLHLRRVLNGFPARIQADNALLTPKSKSLRFLKLNGVEVTHGLAHVSRSQTHAERALGTLTRLLTKFHTAAPSTSLERLVEEVPRAGFYSS
ncbi:MAG: integrase, partial [Bacteroidota bacterium]